ncbi:MAG TPA: NACHT domain-containing protein [Pyrinomonadaceae bacterium]|nr:NACHT domain-containing protein [Pyrinomonadaceae bacterium]
MSPLTTATTVAWLWENYGKTITDKAAGAVKDKWKKFKWKDAAEAYRAKVKKLHGTMQIMGMAKAVPIDDIFTEAYMLDKPTAFGRHNIEELKKLSADPDAPPPNAKRIGGLELVNSNKNLFILGKPGAGKTTFLKYVVVQAAEPQKPIIDKVPIFISLKEWADSSSELMPFIAELFDICGFPDAQPFIENLLKSGNAIVLFDGLDEVNQESGQRDKQIRQMNNFIKKYDRVQCLITCRVAASDYTFKPFTYVEVADFTERQIEQFVRNWFRNNEGEKDEETCKRFLTEFDRDDNKGLRELARTPLLLTLLCLAFNETMTIPQRRVEIYEEALDALLKKWDSSRRIRRDEIYRKLSLGHKENMLAQIAHETFEKNEYFIPQPELERLITEYVKNVPPHDTNEETDGEVILKAIAAQHGIFVERAREVYSFSHLTFQEYFTAKYIDANAAKGTLKNLIEEHCADGRWREVFLLTTSLLSDASPFMMKFRAGVDELLGNDNSLIDLLSWVDKKAASVKDDGWLRRQSYLCIGVYYEVRSEKLDWACEGALASGIASDLAFDLDYQLVQTRYNAGLLILNTEALSRARTLIRVMGMKGFEEELDALQTPMEEEFADALRALMIKHRDIGHEWILTETQEARLADYINATLLLQDCLELATMPSDEKKAIFNSLYLPPARAEDRQND